MSARLSRCMPGPRATSVACVLSLMRAFIFFGGGQVDAGAWGEKQDVVIRCVYGGLSGSSTVVLICVAGATSLVIQHLTYCWYCS